ncbi:site-specific DNA-methyltransferase [Helicobacter pylori]|uniref:site-specific DNA-methyltransferase n=1 Tax=Helicobacter pylori TaxID=210 RepID=UPI001923612C|nr:site-specific DNA-methyltransferase [Helicobacter pylori]QQW71311.1 site-specific DNA-methyltransferase [Helicobacter pylori]
MNLKKHFSNNHDYILTYAKNIEKLHDFTLERTSEMNARYKNLDNDERGVWKSSDLSVGPAVERNIYPIFNPYTKQEIYPPHGRSWVYSQEKLQELIADNRIFFPTSGSGVPRYKRFLSEVKQGTTAMSLWTYQEVGHTQDAKREIKELFEGQALFDTPKPEALLKRIIEISTQENDLVLDFFAGSGTTCAVAHKLKRKYIGIEMGEHFDSVILPRLKKVIGGFKSGVIKEFNGGGVVKVYALESYEEILRKIKYEDNDKPLAYDEQYSDLVECKNESYTLNLNALEKMGVDIKETLENLWGLKVEFFNERVVKFKENDKEVEILKALKEALIW